MHRVLSQLLLILALLFSPSAMIGGVAAAHGAAPAAAALPSHCAEQPGEGSRKHSAEGIDCAIACAALPASLPAANLAQLMPERASRAAEPVVLVGLAPESDTPPPRSTPAI